MLGWLNGHHVNTTFVLVRGKCMPPLVIGSQPTPTLSLFGHDAPHGCHHALERTRECLPHLSAGAFDRRVVDPAAAQRCRKADQKPRAFSRRERHGILDDDVDLLVAETK